MRGGGSEGEGRARGGGEAACEESGRVVSQSRGGKREDAWDAAGGIDWGGEGESLLLLHGMADTPHVYDKLAPKFTNQFRVLALTRRGHGERARLDYRSLIPEWKRLFAPAEDDGQPRGRVDTAQFPLHNTHGAGHNY